MGAVLSGLCATRAKADTGDVVMSEVLFRDGKDLLARKDYARACPKLAESFRLDPASGTLLALAVCHEREGKLASAWGEYADVASRSKLEARPDRERAARAKAAELEPRLSTLTIALSEGAAVAGLEIRRGGVLVAPAWLGTAVPVDGGPVTIEAAAPGRRPWRAQVMIAPAGDKQTVTIPWLEGAGSGRGTPQPPRPRAEASPPPSDSAEPAPDETPAPESAPALLAAAPLPRAGQRSGLSPLQVGGVVVGAVGVAGLGVGAAFGVLAIDKYNASKSQCTGDFCTAAGKSDRNAALTAGNVASVGFIAGPVLLAAGTAMILLGIQRTESRPASPTAATFQAVPLVGPGGVGGLLRGSF